MLILVAFEAFALQYGPRLVADAIDQGINPQPPGTPTDFTIVWQLSLVYVGLLVAATVVGAIRTAWSGRIGEDVLYGLRNRVFSHIQRLSLDYFTDEKAGRIMTRATSDIEAIQMLFQQGLINMWLQVCTLTVVVWQMFSMNTTLALYVVLGVVPTMTLLTIWFRSQSDYGYLAVRDWIAHLMSRSPGEPVGHAGGRRAQPPAVQPGEARQHRRRVPQGATSTPRTSAASTAPARSSSACSRRR